MKRGKRNAGADEKRIENAEEFCKYVDQLSACAATFFREHALLDPTIERISAGVLLIDPRISVTVKGRGGKRVRVPTDERARSAQWVLMTADWLKREITKPDETKRERWLLAGQAVALMHGRAALGGNELDATAARNLGRDRRGKVDISTRAMMAALKRNQTPKRAFAALFGGGTFDRVRAFPVKDGTRIEFVLRDRRKSLKAESVDSRLRSLHAKRR